MSIKKIELSPYPSDDCCMRCGNHVSTFKTFENNDDIPDEKLKKRHRHITEDVLWSNVYDMIIDNLKTGSPRKDEEDFYGKEKVEAAINYYSLIDVLKESWECRDCFFQEPDEWFIEL